MACGPIDGQWDLCENNAKVKNTKENTKMIAIGSDHGGFALKEELKKHLTERGIEFKDYGTFSAESCDYPTYAEKVCSAVVGGEAEKGILCCGTGIGMSMAANKVPGIRAALCTTEFHASFARAHNNANIICLGERVTGPGIAADMVDIFLATAFEGGRHLRRISLFS